MTQVVQGITRSTPLDLRLRKAAPAPVSAFDKLDIDALGQEAKAAAALVRESRLDEAIAAYTALLAKVPGLTSVHLQLGQIYRLKKDFPAAIAEYETITEADTQYGLARIEIGLTELERGDLDAAERVLAAAADSDAAGPETYYSLGEVMLARSDPSAASQWYEKARAADPAWTRPLVRLGQVAIDRGDVAAGTTYLQQVISLDPSGPDAADARALLSKVGP
jgi:tetratricopeptide (TPR) repeat protein